MLRSTIARRAAALATLVTVAACSAPPGSPQTAITAEVHNGPVVGDTVDAGTLASRVSTALAKASSGFVEVSEDSRKVGELKFATVGGKRAFQLQMATAEGVVTLIVIDRAVYIGDPHRTSESTKPWIKVSPEGKEKLSQLAQRLLASAGGFVRAEFGTVARHGQASVTRVAAGLVTYRMEIDPEKFSRLEAAGLSDPSTIESGYLEVTVDKDDRPTVVVTHVVAGSTYELTARYIGLGLGADVVAPPDNAVQTAPS